MVDLELEVVSNCLPLAHWQSIHPYLSHKDLLSFLEQLQISLNVTDVKSTYDRHWLIGLDSEVKPRLMAVCVAIILQIEVVLMRIDL